MNKKYLFDNEYIIKTSDKKFKITDKIIELFKYCNNDIMLKKEEEQNKVKNALLDFFDIDLKQTLLDKNINHSILDNIFESIKHKLFYVSSGNTLKIYSEIFNINKEYSLKLYSKNIKKNIEEDIIESFFKYTRDKLNCLFRNKIQKNNNIYNYHFNKYADNSNYIYTENTLYHKEFNSIIDKIELTVKFNLTNLTTKIQTYIYFRTYRSHQEIINTDFDALKKEMQKLINDKIMEQITNLNNLINVNFEMKE